jgi:phosphatidylglycerol---prolipoprotein diacylglyceryl transferase
MPTTTGSPIYLLTTVTGIVCTAVLWAWLSRVQAAREGRVRDARLPYLYGAGLCGAFLGAKVAFLFAEGWAYRDNWGALLTGHSITGALLGGTVGVEWAKHAMGYARSTGDLFAVTVPLAVAIGRIGCIAAGCCLGVECSAEHADAWWAMTDAHGHARWPAAAVEMAFNLAFLGWAVLAWRFDWQRDRRFAIYLIAYGAFRFAHEFVRDDSRWFGAFGGYHAVALAIIGAGVVLYVRRIPGSGRPVQVAKGAL